MLKSNPRCTLPEEALAMARYHSCYPWHTGGAYRQFMTEKDYALMNWVLEFNKFDLYTKDDNASSMTLEMVNDLWPYYEGLMQKYGLDGKLEW